MVLLTFVHKGTETELSLKEDEPISTVVSFLRQKFNITAENILLIYKGREIQLQSTPKSFNYIRGTPIYTFPIDFSVHEKITSEYDEKQIKYELELLDFVSKGIPYDLASQILQQQNNSTILALNEHIDRKINAHNDLTPFEQCIYKDKQISAFLPENEIKSSFINLDSATIYPCYPRKQDTETEQEKRTGFLSSTIRDLYFEHPEKIERLIKIHCPDVFQKYKENPERGLAFLGMIRYNNKTAPIEFTYHCKLSYLNDITAEDDKNLQEFYNKGFDPETVRMHYIACNKNLWLLRKMLK